MWVILKCLFAILLQLQIPEIYIKFFQLEATKIKVNNPQKDRLKYRYTGRQKWHLWTPFLIKNINNRDLNPKI